MPGRLATVLCCDSCDATASLPKVRQTVALSTGLISDSRQDFSKPGVLLWIVNESITRSGVGKHLIVKRSEPANDECLLEVDGLICDSVGIEHGLPGWRGCPH